MQIVQNKIWMRFLVLGVFSLFFFGFSCRKIERVQIGEFIYINSTNHTINFFTPHFNSFNLLGLKTHVIKESQVAGKKIGLETFRTPFTNSNSLVITFDGNKCLTMTNLSENSLLNISHYSAEKIDAGTYKFTYTFTEADYNRATTCP
ncbi:MAG: hypothetical protein KAY27_01645 [Pedobacter sp.]|nr:hypothetical protein [Pedobacter sp.]